MTESPPLSVTESLPRAIALLESGLPAARVWELSGAQAAQDPAVSAGCRLSEGTGAPLAQVLRALLADRVADEDAATAREAATAGALLSARILGALPLLGIGLAALVDPSSALMLVTTVWGGALLLVAAALTLAGVWWMRRMVVGARVQADPGSVPALVTLLASVLRSGASLPMALSATATACAGAGDNSKCLETHGLSLVAQALLDGEEWDAAWDRAAPALGPVREALDLARVTGASALPTLTAAGETLRRRARRDAAVAASELNVRMTLPLALCLLPAFMLVGVLPLVIATVRGVGVGAVSW